MKVSQMINESKVFIDDRSSTWSQDVIGKLPASDKVVGIGGFSPTKDFVLIALNSHDKNMVSQIKLSLGEKIYRYATTTTLAGGMKPLVKVNVNKAFVYFLTQDAVDNDSVEFEPRAERLKFLRLLKDNY